MTARSTPRVIVATAIYPPDPRVGGMRPAKLVRAFVARGFDVHVITSAATGATAGFGPSGEQLHVVSPRRTIRDRYAAARSGSAATPPAASRAVAAGVPAARARAASLIGTLKSTALAPFTVPDLERGLIGPLARRARQLLADRPGIVYSTAPPHSTSVAIALALRGNSAPWIAEFRDPWTGGQHANSERGDWLGGALHGWLEAAVLRRADAFVGVSDGIADWLHRRTSGKPIVVSRNGIDRIADRRQVPLPHPSVHALYAGELYLGRDPSVLFDVLRALRDDGTITADTFAFRLVGQVDQFRGTPTANMIASRDLAAIVTTLPPVSRSTVEEFTEQAQLLVLFAQQQPLQVPNKLYEYLGSRKPILAFVDHGGESARLLRAVGGHFLVTEQMSPEARIETVRQAIAAARRGDPAGDDEQLGQLAADRQLAPVADLVETMWTTVRG